MSSDKKKTKQTEKDRKKKKWKNKITPMKVTSVKMRYQI